VKGAKVEIPEATICHLSATRLRLKIPSRRGDDVFFSELEHKISGAKEFRTLKVNPVTGSVLLEREHLQLKEVGRLGRSTGAFDLIEPSRATDYFADRVGDVLNRISSDMHRFSGGTLDLPAAVFLGLLTFGVIEIARGNFRAPPWYTVFWYAFGIYTKALLDRGPSS
jgi:hypothetical protein